jgi:hypothetical protein
MRSDNVQYPVLILNHKSGKVKNGCWLSNSHSDEPYGTHTHTYKQGSAGYNNFSKQATLPAVIGKTDENKQSLRDVDMDAIEVQKQIAAGTFDWEKYYEDNKEKWDDEQGIIKEKKDLTKEDNNGKIVILKSVVNRVKKLNPGDPDYYLLDQLNVLRGMSDNTIKEYMKAEPEMISDIIVGLYAKCTMKHENIIDCINNPKQIDNMVNLLRNMAIDNERRAKTGR